MKKFKYKHADVLVDRSEKDDDYNIIDETYLKKKDINNVVTIDTDQSISGKKTFTNVDGIAVNSINSTKGNALMRYKDTEGKNVFGGSNYPVVLMGSTDRPYYSKDGSDFNGEELALKSDLSNAGTSVYIVRH